MHRTVAPPLRIWSITHHSHIRHHRHRYCHRHRHRRRLRRRRYSMPLPLPLLAQTRLVYIRGCLLTTNGSRTSWDR